MNQIMGFLSNILLVLIIFMNSLALISVMRGSLYANWFFGLVNYILLPILVVISAYTNKKGSQFYVRSISVQQNLSICKRSRLQSNILII